MKRLVPLLALVPLVASYSVSGKYSLPPLVLVVLFTALLGCFCSDAKDNLLPGLGLFWLGPIGAVWTISERREGRDIWAYSLPVSLAIGALGTLLLLRKAVPRHQIWLIVAAIMTWCVSFFGGSGGGADRMESYYSFFGLSKELTWTLIVISRKLIHITFYSFLATCFYKFLTHFREKPVLPALSFALSMAVCDEWRQNLMPNREGSYRDVLLDIGAASVWLWWSYVRTSSAKPAVPDSDVRA